MPSNGLSHGSASSRTRYTELLYHISDFQGIFISEAHQRPERVERSVVMEELHIELTIPIRQRSPDRIPGPLLEKENSHLP